METVSEKTGSVRGPFFEKKGVDRPCWSCKSEQVDLFNCISCKTIQEFLSDTNYFASLNQGYTLNIDLEQLEKQYYDLSRRFHPDYFQQRSKEEQEISLENTALLNKAYQTLKDPQKRASYLVRLVEGNDEPLKTQAPASLFEDIFEIQEAVEEMRFLDPSDESGRNNLKETLKIALEKMQQYQKDEREKLYGHFNEWDQLESGRQSQDFTDPQKSCLTQMKQILSHSGYLDRVIQDIKTALKF